MNHIYDEPIQSKTDQELMVWLMDSSIPKTEAEWFAAKEIPKIVARNVKLKNALQTLCDEQNGPPLLRRKDRWQAAMDIARALLKE